LECYDITLILRSRCLNSSRQQYTYADGDN
jgi:hypothetical protein